MFKRYEIYMFSFFKSKPTVSLIRLNGVIGNVGRFSQGMSYASQSDIIKKAFALKNIKAVVISINSPGGSPVQSNLLYDLIRSEADDKKVKVITYAEDVAASGGYMLMCAGDEIYANANSIVGSIGVIYSAFGFQELIKKIGVQRRVHTAGESKSILDPFLEEKKEDVEKLKSLQKDLHDEFINLVKKSRKDKLKSENHSMLFSGEFWSGKKSLQLGLIDGVGTLQEILKEKFGKDLKVKKFEAAQSWLKRKLSSQLPGSYSEVINELEVRSIWNKYGL
jgi:signal peptide peptidase SppA